MSKMDGLRAMREARYAETAARAGSAAPGAKVPAAKKTSPTKAAATPRVVPAAQTPDTTLCGHRNMSGRTCTREHGHAAKSHRYS